MASFVERALVMLMIMAAVQVSFGAVYKVGDSDGWTIIGNVDYKKWAATKNFKVGDTIIFEYNADFHNVMRVTHEMYKSCDVSSPLNTFTSGNDSIKITNYGHHFFLCGVPGHCPAGQKVDINVIKKVVASPSPSPSPAKAKAKAKAPTPSASAMASPVPVANVHGPTSPNNAASLIALKGAFFMMPLLALAL